jgi:NADPH-dependent ferric siderophore reductase
LPQPLPEPANWQLEVAQVQMLTPRMRRIALTSPELSRLTYVPGQDISLAFTGEAGQTVRRRYTIRRFNPERKLLEINVVMHGNGPGMRWAQAATPGMQIQAIAPRGKITLADDADWHLFAGDATAVPASLAMIDALADRLPAQAWLQVDNAAEQQALERNGGQQVIEWRYGADSAAPELLSALVGAPFPPGRGHAYLAGEVALVLALKARLVSRGWALEQISAKAYWNRGRPNAERGEPEQRAS